MITISILGLDQFVVGHYSKDHSANIANLYETSDDLINFYAPNSMVFHNGIEQTSWNALVRVSAPSKYKPLEAKVADYILDTLSQFSINVEVEFEYFEQSVHYERINTDYPRFIAESNLVNEDDADKDDVFDDATDDDEEPDPRDRADLNPNDENQIYLGNVFADVVPQPDSDESTSAGKKTAEKKSGGK